MDAEYAGPLSFIFVPDEDTRIEDGKRLVQILIHKVPNVHLGRVQHFCRPSERWNESSGSSELK